MGTRRTIRLRTHYATLYGYHPLRTKKPKVIGAIQYANPTAADISRAIRRFKLKMLKGAKVFATVKPQSKPTPVTNGVMIKEYSQHAYET